MPGYFTLHNENFEALFQGNEVSVEHVPASEQLINPYVFEKTEKLVIVRSPISINSLTDVLKDIEHRVDDMANKHLLLGVVGQGATEQHIVTLHIPPQGEQPTVYDSKGSNPERFFSYTPSRNTVGGLIGSILQTINPFAAKGKEIDLSHLQTARLSTVRYFALGTQSFFDGFTCGYHSGSNIKALAKLIEQDIKPTVALLLANSKNPVTTSAQLLAEVTQDKVNMSFSSFIKKAWQDTYLPFVTEKKRDKYHFGHYFMGWPSHTRASKLAYFMTLKFITSPLSNAFSLVTEFPINVLSESCSFLKNKLFAWAATNPVTQGIRSLLLLPTIGLQAALKSISYLLRTITSPLVSFTAAKKVHPALGYLSALASVILIGAGIGAFAVFAPPAIIAQAFVIGGKQALTVLYALAFPFTKLFAALDLSISTSLAATLTLISTGLILSVLHLIGRKIIYPKTTETTTKNELSSVPQIGSNASDLLPKARPEHALEEDFDLADSLVESSSAMLRSSFGRRKSSITEENATEDFHLEDPQDTMDPRASL